MYVCRYAHVWLCAHACLCRLCIRITCVSTVCVLRVSTYMYVLAYCINVCVYCVYISMHVHMVQVSVYVYVCTHECVCI